MRYKSVLVIVSAILGWSASFADTYPSRPVELVVPYQPGGGTDTLARAFGVAAANYFPKPIVVINKPGASGGIGLAYVATGPTDGYRLATVFPELMSINLMGITKVAHDDLQPVARLTSDPSAITVRADARWKTVEEFLAYAKANPATVTIANAGNGTSPHLAAAGLAEKLGSSFIHVPYQGSAPAIMALAGGQVDATTVSYGELKSYVESGRLKTLAVMSDKRLPSLPDVPTLRERGVDLTFDVWRGIAVAKNTPPEIVKVLREAAAKVSKDGGFQETLAKQLLTSAYMDGPELKAAMAAQNEYFKKLLPTLKVKD